MASAEAAAFRTFKGFEASMAQGWVVGEGEKVTNATELVANERVYPAGTVWIVVFEPSPYDDQILLNKLDETTFVRVGRLEWKSFSRVKENKRE